MILNYVVLLSYKLLDPFIVALFVTPRCLSEPVSRRRVTSGPLFDPRPICVGFMLVRATLGRVSEYFGISRQYHSAN
jgi:hypothetical protein